jgi:hypothetical protein
VTRTRTLGLLLAAVLTAGCTTADPTTGRAPAESPEPAVSTLTPVPLPPEGPPSGRLVADLRQSSRDAALGRMEVWIGNDTARDLTPTRIIYTDPRFRRPVAGERLRLNPSRSERGYPLTLPARPACGRHGTTARVTVAYAGRTVRLRVTDDNDIVRRYVAGRCLELAVDRVARIGFADRVPADHPGEGSTGVLTLVARPTGRPGHTLTIDTVGGTPLLSAADRSTWSPHTRISSRGPIRRIQLPVQPARCDDHVFLEAAGATAFLVGLRLDGRPGRLVLRMDPAGAAAAISFARASCGL